jgi:hypothetical protein
MSLKRFLAVPFAAFILIVAAFAQTLPQGVQKVTSLEGITEYAFPNSLRTGYFPQNQHHD